MGVFIFITHFLSIQIDLSKVVKYLINASKLFIGLIMNTILLNLFDLLIYLQIIFEL